MEGGPIPRMKQPTQTRSLGIKKEALEFKMICKHLFWKT